MHTELHSDSSILLLRGGRARKHEQFSYVAQIERPKGELNLLQTFLEIFNEWSN